MRILSIIGLFLLVSCGPGQKLNSPSLEKNTEYCLSLFRNNQWEETLRCLEKIPDRERDVTYYDLAGSAHEKLGDYSAASEAFHLAIERDSTHTNPSLLFKKGEILWKTHQYREAGETFKIYRNLVQNPHPQTLKKVEYYLRSFSVAEDLYRHPRNFQPLVLPETINSPFQELGASMTYDRRNLVFTRRDKQEDLYISTKGEQGWETARPITTLNTPDNEGAASISGDGQLLVYTACNHSEGVGSCDLFYTQMTDTGWAKGQIIPHVNSRNWDSQPALSQDGRAMIFSSERPGGYGGRDLWLTVLNPNGDWIRPINLGPEINTAGNEENPFLHTDEQTLYFTSDYLPGFGGRDIFLSHRKEGNQWTEPVNLGYPINSHFDEEGILVTSAGDEAIFASARTGQFDLYHFQLEDPEIQPIRAYLYQLYVISQETRQPVPRVRIQVSDLTEGRLHRHIITDSTGFAAFLLQSEKQYGITLTHKNYGLESYRVESPDHLLSDITDTLYIRPFQRNRPIVLENVFFETGKSELLPDAEFELLQLTEFLLKNLDLNIELTGHTDNVGNSKDNLTLSKNRADAVKLFLEENGIKASRIRTEGKGDTEPVAPNDTPEGRQKNRRTEMTIE